MNRESGRRCDRHVVATEKPGEGPWAIRRSSRYERATTKVESDDAMICIAKLARKVTIINKKAPGAIAVVHIAVSQDLVLKPNVAPSIDERNGPRFSRVNVVFDRNPLLFGRST